MKGKGGYLNSNFGVFMVVALLTL